MKLIYSKSIFAVLVLLTACSSSSSGSSGSSGSGGIGDTCGAQDGGCSVELFCKFDGGSCGDSGDEGVCSEVPEACIELYQPVCGCDGQTYSNSCFAEMNRRSVRSEGECEAL